MERAIGSLGRPQTDPSDLDRPSGHVVLDKGYWPRGCAHDFGGTERTRERSDSACCNMTKKAKKAKVSPRGQGRFVTYQRAPRLRRQWQMRRALC